MKVFKLTDNVGKTRSNTQWGENISHTAKGNDTKLCSNGWIHYYTHPLLAVLLNPIHVSFTYPKLWEAEASGEIINEALKSGCKTLMTIKEIPLPEISRVQRIVFGILCAKEVCKDEVWNKWADKWLSGEDRSEKSARAARADASLSDDAYAANASYAASYAARAAARAANAAIASNAAAADAAAYASNAAADAAAAAADAAAADSDIDESINFIELAEKAMTYK